MPLKDKKGLVIGIANSQSVAYGCAAAFASAGASLAVTYLNTKAEPYVRPLAERLECPIIVPCDVSPARPARGGVRSNPRCLGESRLCASFHCVRAKGGFAQPCC